MTHLARLVAAASLARARAHEEGADVVTWAGVLPGASLVLVGALVDNLIKRDKYCW